MLKSADEILVKLDEMLANPAWDELKKWCEDMKKRREEYAISQGSQSR
jgi:hypothetical protein